MREALKPKMVIPVIINGSGGVGKDEFVNICRKLCDNNVNQFADVTNISSVEIIKNAAVTLGWDYGKTEKDRKFLSDLKALSKKYNNAPIKYMMNKYNNIADYKITAGIYILFFHIREIDEIKEFASMVKNPVTLLIRRNSVKEILSNSSDANVENFKYDIVIDNNGTLEDLENKAAEFLSSITGGLL